MKVLVACEESQRVCTEFRHAGCEAYSADVQKPSGGHPEWHILGDVLPYINGNCTFKTMDGVEHKISCTWDLLIAHPPCTYLTNAGARWFDEKKYGENASKRKLLRQSAYRFFMDIAEAECDRIAIENPIGYMNSHYRKPDQIIQPYFFGDPEYKTTCLWLKGVPCLKPTKMLENPLKKYPTYISKKGYTNHVGFVLRHPNDSVTRSKTFPGIARAMAEQWGKENPRTGGNQ